MEYPYQIVSFLDAEPVKGQLIYGDESGGWLAQIALKRRFALKDTDESEFVRQLEEYFALVPSFETATGTLTKPDALPVEVIPIHDPIAATTFHHDFLTQFSSSIISKYPDREDKNYFPHITAQFWGKYVINVARYENKSFPISSVWLVKDASREQNTQALERFLLGN